MVGLPIVLRSAVMVPPVRVTALLSLTTALVACESQSSSSSVDPVYAARADREERYVSLFEAAIQEVFDRRSAQGLRTGPTVVLDAAFTMAAYRVGEGQEPEGPTGNHVRRAFGSLAAGAEGWREGELSKEIVCEPLSGYPRRSCVMNESTFLLGVTPRHPGQGRGRLENGDYEVLVWTRAQVARPLHRNGARTIAFSSHSMVFRYVEGKWVLISYGVGAA